MSELYEILQSTWKLRRHPFDPRVASPDDRIDLDVYSFTLDPTKDLRVVEYYYDFYQWNFIGPLAQPQGGSFFPDPQNLPDSGTDCLLALISGIGHTGRRSMAKLLIHKFTEERDADPLVIEATLSRASGLENAKGVARQFNLKYGKTRSADVRKTLKDIYEEETAGEAAALTPYYPVLFANLKTVVEPPDLPIVMVLKGPDQYSLWIDMYESLKDFCDLIVVTTVDPKQAQICKQTMDVRGKNAAWVHAPPLDKKKALDYLAERLSRERLTGAHLEADEKLAPFTNEAIDEIYRKGDEESRQAEELTWPIRFLNKRFRCAIDEHLSRLVEIEQKGELDQIVAHHRDELRIGKELVREIGKQINGVAK